MTAPRTASTTLPNAVPGTAAKGTATLRDVANLAGVSTAAVSKFINGKQRFTEAVEQRITQAIASVGYQQNLAARSMVTGRSGAIAVLVAGVENPYTAAVIQGASRVATTLGYDLLFVDLLHSEPAERELARVMAMQVDGIVLAAPLNAAAAEMLARYGRPCVDMTRRDGEGGSLPSDSGQRAGALLGRHLLSLGLRRIVYLACHGLPDSDERGRGLRSALEAGGARLDEVQIAQATPEAGAAAASLLLLGGERASGGPQAIVACNDLVAMGLLSEARRLGLQVPRDVSVAGFENMPFGRFLSPPLTSVELHADALGDWAMRRLLALVDGQPAPTVPDDLEPRLVIRGSLSASVG